MTREITKTTVKLAKMEMNDGIPEAIPLEDETFIGNFSLEKAQKYVDKIHQNATVLEVHPETQIYEMPIETFMEHGKIKETKQK